MQCKGVTKLDYTAFIKQSLHVHQMPYHDKDVPYFQHILDTIFQEQQSLQQFPNLHEKVPITIVDLEVLKYD